MPVLMILMYLTPILYPLTLVPESVRPWVAANPFGWLVGRLRDALLDGRLALQWSDAVARGRRARAVLRRTLGVPPALAALRGFRVSDRASGDMTAPLLTARDVGKDYAKVDARGGRMRLVCDLLRGRGAPPRVPRARRRELRAAARRIARRHRRERRGQVDAAQDRRRRDRAHARPVAVSGRVGALLELGSGFHPEYTGLANIDLAAALLGLAPREIAAKRDEIIAFADIGEHIDDPIKHYSSGMVVRLGFAVATALAPDILITDEVLAVGDESFQKKCIAWMERYLADGGTLLLCSHSMYHVQKLCRARAVAARTAASSATVRRPTSRRPISRITRKRARGAKRADRRAARPRRSGRLRGPVARARARRLDRAGRGRFAVGRSVLARRPRCRSC